MTHKFVAIDLYDICYFVADRRTFANLLQTQVAAVTDG